MIFLVAVEVTAVTLTFGENLISYSRCLEGEDKDDDDDGVGKSSGQVNDVSLLIVSMSTGEASSKTLLVAASSCKIEGKPSMSSCASLSSIFKSSTRKPRHRDLAVSL